MSMDRLMTEVLASGKWKQCAFCKRAMPTQEWRAEVIGKGLGHSLGATGERLERTLDI